MSNPLLQPPRTETVWLLPADYEDRLADLSRRIDEAHAASRSDKRKRAAADKLAAELDEQRDPANVAGAVAILVREVPNRVEEKLLNEHPPRKGNRRDQIHGYNVDTFPSALVRLALVEPEVTDAQFDEWLATVGPARWGKVWDAVNRVNHGEIEVPKSSAVSLLREMRATESRRPPGTE